MIAAPSPEAPDAAELALFDRQSTHPGCEDGTMQIVRRVATITGLVQGVSFRWYTLQEAERLGLTGWVRNHPEGSVHLEVQGPRSQVDEFHRWLHEGPTHAQVDDVSVSEVDPVNGEDEFRVLH